MIRILAVAALLLSCVASIACKHAVSDNVAATVNGRVITFADLDKQYQSQFMSSGERPSDDQMLIQKLEILRTMIDNKIMLQRAERLGLMATDSDVEAKFVELRSPFTEEEFQKQLRARKMSVDDLKAQLRQDLSIQKLFNKEITSHISISDKDVADFYNGNKTSFNYPEPQVHMAQILVTSTPDSNVRNLKNDKAQNEEQAQKKIEMIAARLRQGGSDNFALLAQNFSEDSSSSQTAATWASCPNRRWRKRIRSCAKR